jgi:glycine C-acetyltransferase
VELISQSTALRDTLERNTLYFREGITKAGFKIRPGQHPIVPIMLYEAKIAQQMAARLLEEGIYVIGFFFPVVAQGQARIRVQISAAHETEHLDRAIAAFTKIGKEMGVIK